MSRARTHRLPTPSPTGSPAPSPLHDPSPVRLVLASASPRRRQLLASLGLPFDVVAPDVDESPLAGESAERLAIRLAASKVAAVAADRPDAVVLGADTVVAQAGESLGKPVDAAAAVDMLRQLRGRRHAVITGVSVRAPGGTVGSATVRTQVLMRNLSDREIADYVARGEALDKAGAYAIQDTAFQPVDSFRGCYTNVVGLPLCLTAGLLRGAGVELPPQAADCLHDGTRD